MTRTFVFALWLALPVLAACQREKQPQTTPSKAAASTGKMLRIGLVTDVGGRGDGSFNDAALRGLELWAAGKRYTPSGYTPASEEERLASLPSDDAAPATGAKAGAAFPVLPVEPLVLQSRAQEDYEPQLQLLVDRESDLVIGSGFMLENAVEASARENPKARFLLIDSPLLDAEGKPKRMDNVRTVVFREEQGSFLAGALAGLVTKTGKVGFIGGMEIPLIQKFEVGYRAGVATTNPSAAKQLLLTYTGSFDKAAAGKQVAQDLLAKGVDVLFHAAGSDGLGVIQAVKDARAQGKDVYVIGVDSDQAALAPGAVLSSMVKRVDLAVYEAARDVATGKFTAGDRTMGLAEHGVALAPIRIAIANKPAVLSRLEALRADVGAGKLAVPQTREELASFKVAP